MQFGDVLRLQPTLDRPNPLERVTPVVLTVQRLVCAPYRKYKSALSDDERARARLYEPRQLSRQKSPHGVTPGVNTLRSSSRTILRLRHFMRTEDRRKESWCDVPVSSLGAAG